MKTLKFLLLICLLLNINQYVYTQTWLKVGDAFFNDNNSTPIGFVYSLKKIDDLLYVGGAFYKIGNTIANSIAIWDGNNWDTLNSSLTGAVYDICKFNNELFISGGFYAGIPNTACFAKWGGVSWESVGGGLTNVSSINSLVYKNLLYLGGATFHIGSLNPNYIASWNGIDYSGLSGGLTGWMPKVRAMCVYNDELIVGGEFSKAGNITTYNIAAWDGANWNDLDSGVSSGIYAFCIDSINNFLYVAGAFSWIGIPPGSNSEQFAIWDGFKWHAFGNSYPAMSPMSLAIYNNNIYIGSVSQNGLTTDTVFVKYDGVNFTPILGPNNGIKALEVYNNELYVGGYFKKVNNDTMIGIARYHEPPDTVSCTFIQPLIHAMPFGTKEEADTIYTTAPYHIQFYTNNKYASSWSWDFGDGGTAATREPEHTYAAPGTYNVTLEVIHPHNLSSQVCTLNVAKTITIIDNTAVKETAKDTVEYLGQNVPNPFNHSTSIPYYVPFGSKGVLQIHNAAGGLVAEYQLQEGKQALEVSMKDFKARTYFYSIVIDGEKKGSRKMVLE